MTVTQVLSRLSQETLPPRGVSYQEGLPGPIDPIFAKIERVLSYCHTCARKTGAAAAGAENADAVLTVLTARTLLFTTSG